MNNSLSSKECAILRQYPKAVFHLRKQYQNNGRLSLVLGAGVSKGFGLPMWRQLVSRVAADRRIDGETILRDANERGLSNTIIAQLLYERLKDSIRGRPKGIAGETSTSCETTTTFRQIVHDGLYKHGGGNISSHPYLLEFLPVIRNSALTITYNFDDCLERLLLKKRQRHEMSSRGYEVVTDTTTHFRLPRAVIYHPNGILPKANTEAANEALVFTEEHFANQIFDSVAGYYATFHNHLTKATCLFLGLGLDDGGLRHILRQHERNSPGNVHYFVHYVDDRKRLTKQYRAAVQKTNFELYNLYTLFLDDNGIAALGKLITRNDLETLTTFCRTNRISSRYIYYITGVPGSGKSTATTGLKCFHTIDEWLDERLPEMSRKFTDLTARQRTKVDNWTRDQFVRKNTNLLNEKEGISVVDRTPLDPLAFTEQKGVKEKANAYKVGFSEHRIEAGQIVLFTGNFKEFEVRIKALGKDGDPKYLRQMENRIKSNFRHGYVSISVSGLSKHQMIKRLLRLILYESYKPIQLYNVLERITSK